MRDILVSATIPVWLGYQRGLDCLYGILNYLGWSHPSFEGATPPPDSVRTDSISPAARIVGGRQPEGDGAFAAEHPLPAAPMCACWPHWMVLPEDLRSELLTSYGRGELTNYHRNLLRAVEVWRDQGVWRVRPR